MVTNEENSVLVHKVIFCQSYATFYRQLNGGESFYLRKGVEHKCCMAKSWAHVSALAVSRNDSSISEQASYSSTCAVFVSPWVKLVFFV